MRLREDILRGVRLFAIVFAAILLCVAAYRIVKAPPDVQSAAPPAAEAAQPTPEPSANAAPAPEAAPEVHPLVVPEPPPVAGAPKKVVRKVNVDVPPPPPLAPPVKARRPPSGKEFEASGAVALPAAPVEDQPEAKPLTPKQAVGYKSLIEANKDRLPVEPTPIPDSRDDPPEQAPKGNRFFKALGKIFHPSGKKDTDPAPPKQP